MREMKDLLMLVLVVVSIPLAIGAFCKLAHVGLSNELLLKLRGDLPFFALTGLIGLSGDLFKCLVQRQVVTNGVLPARLRMTIK